jgi:hypothetical protein
VIDIEAVEEGCELTLTHAMRAEWAEYAERTEKGWTTMLDGLARSLGGVGRAMSFSDVRAPMLHYWCACFDKLSMRSSFDGPDKVTDRATPCPSCHQNWTSC